MIQETACPSRMLLRSNSTVAPRLISAPTSSRHASSPIACSTGEVPYGGMGGQAGLPQNRPVYERRYQPPSRLCPYRGRVPKRIWQVIDEILTTGLALDANRRFQSSPLWLDALEDLYCEMRRKVRFGFWDSLLIRLFERFGGRRGSPDEDQPESLGG